MNPLTIETDIVIQRESNWIVATLPSQRHFSVNPWDLLRLAGIDRLGPAVRLLPRWRSHATACVELPLSAETNSLHLDRRLRRRLLPRCDEPTPGDDDISWAFEELSGALTKQDDGWTFRPHENDIGPLTVRLTPGGLSLRAKLVALGDWPPLTKQAVGVFFGRVQSQLRFVRIAMNEEVVYLEGWADTEALAEDGAFILDGFRQVVPRLRRSLHALTFQDVAQAYVQCDRKPD